jgi:lincosamide nucleotidyltransferase A/C/D/E
LTSTAASIPPLCDGTQERALCAITAEEVLAVLDRLAEAGVRAWVDGGWGVDALVGKQTRSHEDLDLVIDVTAVSRLVDELVNDGFEAIRDWRPTAIALRHPDGRQLDLHPVTLTADGGGDQIQRDGVRRWHYARPVVGRIGGRSVECCSVQTQVDAHLGYEPDDLDRQDMAVLGEVFNVMLPPPYDRP